MASEYEPIRDWIECNFYKISSSVHPRVVESENLQDMQKYSGIKANLEKMLSPYYKNVKVHFYGSRVIGVATKDSNLNIYIEIDSDFYSNQNIERDRKIIRHVDRILRDPHNSKGKWKVNICFDTFKIPLIRAKYQPCGIKCDIIVTNGFGVMNSLLLKHLFGLQPEAIKLFHFMKFILPRFVKKVDGYLLNILVLFFLQRQHLLPSVRAVQENLPLKLIDRWPFQFDSERNLQFYKLDTLLDYQSVVPSFFNFYGNLSEKVLSLYEGRLIDILEYNLSNIYISCNMFMLDQKEMTYDSPFWVFGPFNQMKNVGKRVTRDNLSFLKRMCSSIFNRYLEHLELHNK